MNKACFFLSYMDVQGLNQQESIIYVAFSLIGRNFTQP